MGIIMYRAENVDRYLHDLKYWCDACGDLHCNGNYDIQEKDLPEELKRAYHDLWEEGTGSLCYLVEYKGEYMVALINEFDEEYARDLHSTMEQLFKHMECKALEFLNKKVFETAQIIIAEESPGTLNCHDFVVLLPWDSEKALFNEVADVLYKNVYKPI